MNSMRTSQVGSNQTYSLDKYVTMKLKDINTKGGGSDFFSLEQGENKLRLVSEFEERFVHWDQANRRSISVSSLDDLFAGEKPRRRFLAYAIDRKDGAIKMLEVGASVIKQLKELAVSEDYGFEDMPAYDITIKKTGSGMDTEYTVIPARENTELTEEELTALLGLTPLNQICELFIKKSKESLGEVETAEKEEVPFD